ncbi:MAG: TetR/AcrR family transcriptional regulator [Clostridia bacterium]|nr:TetR/AcrR family transcriptional regulator [Clostridia bacterium]
MEQISTKEKLILAGMDEIRAYGIEGFSLRRVASRCGVSCGAPYKHFRDKEDMFGAMIRYVRDRWIEEYNNLEPTGDVTADAAEYSLRFVKFLLANPHYKSVLMIKQMGLDSPEGTPEPGIGIQAKRIFARYRKETGRSREDVRARMFVARALAFGAALTLDPDEDLKKEGEEIVRKAFIAIFE